jgi:hypothetical protein
MPKLTPQQLREIYLKLPKDLQDAIFSVDSAERIQSIGKKYNLAIDKTGELADETGLVMLGLTHPNNFISNLAQRLKIDKESARKIGEEINNQIFAEIRESLKKVHGMSEVSKAAEGETRPEEREEILKEIEKEEPISSAGKVPEIIKGTTSPFEAKTKEIVRMPPVEKRYPDGDPYREPIE